MSKLSFTPLEDKTAAIIDRIFGTKDFMIEVNPGRVVMPSAFQEIGQDIIDLPVLESDIWMCSHPRTGSTWAQEMVWLIGHDLDYEEAKRSLLLNRSPLVEMSCMPKNNDAKWQNQSIKGTSVDIVRHSVERPRHVRCHLPWDLLPTDMKNGDGSFKPKVVYTARNPKDVVVSYYHYLCLVHEMKTTFEEFCELFLQGTTMFGPVWSHIFGFWNRRNDPNVLFIKYEEMKRDLRSIIRKIAKFLNKSLSDDDIEKLCEFVSFSNMKSNKAVNLNYIIEKTYGKEYLEKTETRFIRKGEVGDWKNYMSDDLSRRFDAWSEMHLQNTDLKFD